MNIGQVQNSLFIFVIIFKCYCTQQLEDPKPKERLTCYRCEETEYGDCAKGIYLADKYICPTESNACYGEVFYNPYNLGFGAKYVYRRGCTPCIKYRCQFESTVKSYHLLIEHYGKRIQCFDCQENNFGNCAKGVNIETKICFDKAISCYGTVFYSPYNNGYGAKYMFLRGCSTCNASECLVEDTQHGFGLLPEYIGYHFICKYSSCNTNPLEEFKVDFELGIKPH